MKTEEIFHGGPVALNWEDARERVPPPAALRVQLSPFGEFPLRDGGSRHGEVQKCTREAFGRLVARWEADGRPEILVDTDHVWAKNLRVEDDGLCADFELTPRGRGLVGGREYRFVSPAWTLNEAGEPERLCSVALTNRPNLPVRPVVNAENNERKGTAMDPKKIAAALGLPETATEEEILAAIAAVKEAQAKAAEEAADARAEEFAANAVRSGRVAGNSREAVKAAWRRCPEAADAMLNSMAAPTPPPQTLLDNGGGTPPALNAAREGLRKCRSAAEHVAYVTAHAAELARN